MESFHWIEFGGYTDIYIKETKGRTRALYHLGNHSITLPDWARNKAVIIHEHTHGLIEAIYGTNVPPHGVEFCGHQLQMVKELLGEKTQLRLRDPYHQRSIRYLEPEALIKKPLLLEAPK